MFSKNCAENSLKKFINKQFQENFMKILGTLQFGNFSQELQAKSFEKIMN
jgi:hypothetical protein